MLHQLNINIMIAAIIQIIQSIPASAFEWILANKPAFGILVFIGWFIFKYLTWLNNKFSHNDQQLHQHGYRIENVEKRLTAVEGEMTNLKENVHKVQKDLAVLDMKIDQKFEKMDERFDAIIQRFDDKFDAIIQRSDDKFGAVNQRFQEVHQRFDAMDKRFDRMEKRFESYDQKFLAQNEFNLKMLSVLESTIKNNSQPNTNPDLRIQKT